MTDQNRKKNNHVSSDDERTQELNFANIADQPADETEDDADYTVSKTIVIPHLHSNKEEKDGGQKPPKKHKKHKKIKVKKMLRLSRLTVAVLILANILLVLDVYLMTKYASLSQSVFYKINIIVLAVVLAADIFCCVALTYKKRIWLTILLIIAVALDGVGGYGLYALARINSSMDDLTATTYTVNVSAALVIYDAGSTVVSSVSDLEGLTVGYAEGTDTAEIGQEYLDNKSVSVNYQSYTGYTELFAALVNEDIAAAILPVSYEGLIDTDETLYSYYDSTSILASFDSDVTATSEAGADKDLTSEPFTVLVSGENEGLADTIMIVAVNPISMDVTMISIPRDSYVPISCYNGSSSKINASHAVSESCLVQTVEDLTGITIDYTAEFTFSSVIEIVDAVGGVDVYNNVPFYGQSWNTETDSLEVVAIPYDESGGLVHMNGQEALGFVRERHAFLDGDFARERHQQEVIQAVISKVMATKNPNTYLDLLEAAGDNLKTNISSDQMLSFINYAMTKATRYYDSSSITGIFNFRTARITGVDNYVYDSSSGLELWIYQLYEDACTDAYNAVQDVIDINADPDPFGSVSWSGASEYTAPTLIDDYYSGDLVGDVTTSDSSSYDSSTYDDSTYGYSNDYSSDYYSSYDYSSSDQSTSTDTYSNTQTDTSSTTTDNSSSTVTDNSSSTTDGTTDTTTTDGSSAVTDGSTDTSGTSTDTAGTDESAAG